MQYHLDGFTPGDPAIRSAASATATARSPEEVDVLIVGCGPAGLTLAAQLSMFGDISTKIVDQKLGPLQVGQADGVACRSMEMFEAFGFCEKVLKEAYWVNETSFWRPDPASPENIVRADRIVDTEPGLSEFPHTILSQARIHDFYLETMLQSPRRLVPDYGRCFTDLVVDAGTTATSGYPVTATLERVDRGHEGEIETVRARYVVGCDGARSSVRRSIGVALRGDAANKLWGVADMLAVTDFPDIRLKSAIQSSSSGSVLVIPREGGYMFRMYTELGELEPGERAANRDVTSADIIAAAQKVLHPYTLDVKEVSWWSAYEIGQRLSDTFEAAGTDPVVFITGDACHTHSPKAGQGMNVSMADSFNLGWKLASVLLGRSSPALLSSYSTERQAIAQELIDFDREMETLFAARNDAVGSDGTSSDAAHHEAADDVGHLEAQQAKFQKYFTRHARFTAGVETTYEPSLITGSSNYQHLATGLLLGKRFHSEAVVRLGDAKPVHLGHTIKADGRWRIFAFADAADPMNPESRLAGLARFLEASPGSPVLRYTPKDADVDSVIDVRAICQQPHRTLAVDHMPAFLLPRKGRFGLVDYQKVFCPAVEPAPDIFDTRGIKRTEGCLVVIRPDQHIGHILPLDAHDELVAFFAAFMLPPTTS